MMTAGACFFLNYDSNDIYSDVIQSLFDVQFSESGTTARVEEEETYMYFVKLLNECEGNKNRFFSLTIDSNDPDHLTLEEILIFSVDLTSFHH